MLANGQTLEPAETDILIPRNGHELFGSFQEANDKQVVFTLDAGSPVTLSWNQVKQSEVRHKTSLHARSLPAPGSTPEAMDFDSLTIATTNDKLQIRSPSQNFAISQADLVSIGSPAPAKVAGQEASTVWTVSVGALQASSRVRTCSRPGVETLTSDASRIRNAPIGAIKRRLSRSTHLTPSRQRARLGSVFSGIQDGSSTENFLERAYT